ncbi:hypothetical protein SLEP1_g24111 [Rubroshorea leprosula]|uniref:Uncharacterized protein n=1 Tax=Rubroshorea leprosula TaxID=152421 RepID=A0AAV5JQK4_9ROSI|nr:hypothetical protein SLEP1_g24111 [Rubroshorea leprosula]
MRCGEGLLLLSCYYQDYSDCVSREMKIAEAGAWHNGEWCWSIQWRRQPWGRELDEAELLDDLLSRTVLKKNEENPKSTVGRRAKRVHFERSIQHTFQQH